MHECFYTPSRLELADADLRREPLETQGDADQLVPEELALAAALWRLPSSWVTRLAASLIASLLVSPQERRCRRRPRDFTDF
jgi:hypothetical protein